jgi:hypothetical protein
MGLAQYIIRYGIVMGRAMWEASKKGINLFKKPTFTDKKRKVLDKQRKEFEADEKAGIKAGNKMSDASLLKKLNAQKDKGINNKKLGDRADKIVEKKEKRLLFDKKAQESAKSYRKEAKGAVPFVLSKHLLNAPAAATALVGTGASLVHKKQSKKKGK